MNIAPEQFAGLLQECVENELILTEEEREFVQAMQFQTTSGFPFSQEDAKRLQDLHAQILNRQFSG